MSGTVLAADIEIGAEGLDPALAAAILAERGRRMRAAPDEAEVPGLAILRWTLGGEAFALPLVEIRRVLPARPPAPVPGAPATLIGLASVQRRLVNIVDAGPALGVGTGPREGGHLLVLRGPAPRLALLVDQAEAVGRLAAPGLPDFGDGLTAQASDADGGRVTVVNRTRLVEVMGLGRPHGGK